MTKRRGKIVSETARGASALHPQSQHASAQQTAESAPAITGSNVSADQTGEGNIIKKILSLAQSESPDRDITREIANVINAEITALISQSPLSHDYDILILFDDLSIMHQDADRIYKAAKQCTRNILLMLFSGGGHIEPAYFIGKLCRENTKSFWATVVPRQAKSAATLICCGADNIHMGALSELGPIDPQIGGKPALAVKNSIEHLAATAAAYPRASEMLATYLSKSLPIDQLGYYERIAESAVQYAERLLAKRVFAANDRTNRRIASKLVYHYKDHGFVIDAAEAEGILGQGIIIRDSDEYKLGNALYETFSLHQFLLDKFASRHLAIVGSPTDGAVVTKKPE